MHGQYTNNPGSQNSYDVNESLHIAAGNDYSTYTLKVGRSVRQPCSMLIISNYRKICYCGFRPITSMCTCVCVGAFVCAFVILEQHVYPYV
jgi:hypothetical protein